MAPTAIENPILNGPFAEPTPHFQFGDHGITNEIVPSRRISTYFIPIARPKKKGKQLVLDEEWVADRVEENRFINQIRDRVKLWREGGYKQVTKTTSRLLEHWNSSDRGRRLFFCQIEALETAIYLTEVATNANDQWILNELQNHELSRVPASRETSLVKSNEANSANGWNQPVQGNARPDGSPCLSRIR